MTMALLEVRCFNHPLREAGARCLSCTRYYCRECVTEHMERLVCARCLEKLSQPAARIRGRFRAGLLLVEAACGLLLAWMFFYGLGRVLLAIPSPLHEGTLWWERNQPEEDTP